MSVQVRPHVYRGEPGWLVCGRDGRGRRLRVFFRSEAAARRVAAAVRSNPDHEITTKDFQ